MRVEHSARIELDDDAEHVVVLQEIWNLLSLQVIQAEEDSAADLRTRGSSGVDAPFSSFTGGQRTNAALDHIARSIACQGLEPETLRRLKFRGVANACDADTANDDRAIDDVRENAFSPAEGKRTRPRTVRAGFPEPRTRTRR